MIKCLKDNLMFDCRRRKLYDYNFKYNILKKMTINTALIPYS